MSLWNSFLNHIAKPVAHVAENVYKAGVAAGGAIENVVNTATGAAVNEIKTGRDVVYAPAKPDVKITAQATTPKITGTPAGLDNTVAQEIAKNIQYTPANTSSNGDLILKVANDVVNPIISHAITRPISTLALLTDPTSPLYQPGKYEQGFQLNDIKAAYNRSQDVSPMQAISKSELFQMLPVLPAYQNAIYAAGNIDISKVNLWDDQDIKKNFSDNIVGKIYTGTGDFILSNAAITVAGGGLGTVAKGFGKLAGLTTTGKTLAAYEQDINTGLDYFNSDGKIGKFTNAANDVKRLAESKNVDEVINILDPYTVNPRMIDVIVDTTDVNIVKDLLLADKGDLGAIGRLVGKNSSELGYAADVQSTFRNKALDGGGAYHPEGDALDRINALYDDGIKLPEHKKYYETVMDPLKKSPRGGGRDYSPIEPVIGAKKLAAVGDYISSARAASISRDFTDIGGFTERFIGNRLVTRVISFTGSYKPLGFVTFSGARPLDGIVELDAMFDDMHLFNPKIFNKNAKDKFINPKFKDNIIKLNADGTQTIKASEYRNAVKTNFLRATSDIERKQVLESLDENLGLHLAYTNGFVDEQAIIDFTKELRAKISNSHAAFSQKGMGIDAQGYRTTVDPNTQRQLVESHRLAPWNIIEKEIMRAAEPRKLLRAGFKVQDVTKAAFETINRYWTFDVLARPSYIPKQSLAEPALSAFLAHGLGYIVNSIPTAAGNSIKNNRNRVLGFAQKMHDSTEMKSIHEVVDGLSKNLDIAINNLNTLNAEADAFYKTANVSPAAVASNGPKVIKALKEAEAMVDNIELDLLAAAKPFGRIPQVPTFARLEQRINFLEKLNGVSGKYGTNIANARAALGAAKAETHTLIPNASELIKKNEEITKQYAIIDDALKSFGEARYKEAQVLGKSAEYKKRYYGKEVNYRMIDGKYTKIDSLFDENQFGAAMREELSNAQTVSTTYLNEMSVQTRQSAIMRKTPGTITDVTSPFYFEQLAYVANRTMRGDPLVDQILAGTEFKDLVKWGQSPAGLAYAEQFGAQTVGSIPDFIRHRVSFVDRYLPGSAAKAAVLAGDVTSVQLQTILARDLDRLTAIHPTEFDYNAAHEGFHGVKDLGHIDRAMSYIARKTFNALAKPENPIRWSFADKVFLDTIAKKAEILAKQGVEMTTERMNALRQSATAEAIKETEKTFYTIRRQNRASYAMRILTAFPSASLNAFYRYGRFAIQNPTRTTGFLNSYNSMFTTFGIDQYGNPVTNAQDATHIVMPLSKELGLYGDKGIRLSARSIGFLVNTPGPSFFMAAPVSALMHWKPDSEKTIKQALGSNYDIIFPYGPQSSIGSALVPGWASAAVAYVNGDESRADFLNSVKSVMNYYRVLDEMGIQKFPGMDVVRRDARNLYGVKAQWTFASPLGVPIKVDTDPMKLYDDYYNILTEKYLTKGYTRVDAKDLAGFEMLSTLGADFPLDRVTYKGVAQKAYIPAQLENYKRVFKDNNDLVSSLANYDPKLVTLLTLDVPVKKEEFNLSIYRILNDPKTKLPGNVLLNELKLSPEQEETERQINRAWTNYNDKRDKLQSLALSQGKKTLAAAGLDDDLETYAKTVLAEQSPEWFKRFNDPKASDNSFMYAQGLSEITNNVKFMAAHGNSKLWQDVTAFLHVRNVYTTVYQSLPNGDRRKTQLKDLYNQKLADNISQWDPALQEIITRYFTNDTMKTTQVEIK